MKVYDTIKLTLLVLAMLLCTNLWAQVTADFTSDITTSCSVPATVNFTDLSSSPGVGIQQSILSTGDGSVYIINQTSISHTYSQAGNYTVVLIAIDSLGARDTMTKTAYIDLAGALSVTAVITDVSCNGANNGSAMVNTSGGTAPFTYLWSNSTTLNPAINLIAGTYWVTVTDIAGCATVESFNIFEPAPVTVTDSVVNVTCPTCTDGKVYAIASGGTPAYQFSIDGGRTYQVSNVFIGLASGTYAIDVVDMNGCTGNITGIVVDTACAFATTLFSQNDAFCNGTPTGQIIVTTIGGVSPYNYTWSVGAIGPVLDNMPAGTYLVETTDATGCSALDTFMILEPTAIVGSIITTNVLCNGGNDGTATITTTGGTGPYTYTWYNGAPGPSINTQSAGTYSVTVVDAGGCDKVYSFDIFEPAQLNIVGSTRVDASCPTCADGLLAPTVAGGTPPYSYVWSTIPVQIFTGATSLLPGIYTVTVTDANGCTVSAQDTVNVNCNLTVDIGNDTTICFGVHTFNPSVANGTAPYTYLWSTGETTSTIATSNAGTYSVSITDANGCSATDVVVLTDANPSANVSADTTICLGSSVTLFAAGGTSYDWTGGAVSNNNIANPTTAPTLTSLFFVEIDNGTCVSVRSVLVTVEADCTWPGDADNSGLADNDDVLAIGIGYGSTGPTRNNASVVWEGQHSANWTNSLLGGSNYKHIDTDGNGIINDDDTLAISLNYGLSHLKTDEERETTMPMIYIELPDSVSAGQSVQGQLYLGSDSFPLANMYGIKFSMNYNTDFVEENTMSFNFGTSWLGTPGTDLLTFQKDLYTGGRIDGALTGKNHVGRSGFGQIGVVNFTMKDDISGKNLLAIPMEFTFTSIRAIDANEGLIDVSGSETTTIATQEVVGIAAVQNSLPVSIYPNPAQDVLYINAYGQQVESIKLRNVLGEIFDLPTQHSNGTYKLNTEQLAAGIYIVTVQSGKQITTQRVVINK